MTGYKLKESVSNEQILRYFVRGEVYTPIDSTKDTQIVIDRDGEYHHLTEKFIAENFDKVER